MQLFRRFLNAVKWVMDFLLQKSIGIFASFVNYRVSTKLALIVIAIIWPYVGLMINENYRNAERYVVVYATMEDAKTIINEGCLNWKQFYDREKQVKTEFEYIYVESEQMHLFTKWYECGVF
jgi:hypothetical protein